MATKKKRVRRIEIPPMRRGAALVKIEGLSDLIMHAWSEKIKNEMAEGMAGGSVKTVRKPRVYEQEFEACKYKDAKGRDCLLAAALKKSIVNAARNLDGVNMTDLRQQVFIRGERIPIVYEECVMRRDPVRVGQGKPDLRYRPAYRGWSAEFEVEWDPKLNINQVLYMINLAGFSVGIHEWRPERNGEFGRFQLVEAGATGRKSDEVDEEICVEDLSPPGKASSAPKKPRKKAA